MVRRLQVRGDSWIRTEINNLSEVRRFSQQRTLGEYIEGFPEIDITALRKPKDIFFSGAWRIVSESFLEVISSLQADKCYQAFPANVRLRNGKSAGDYFVFHITNCLDCLDNEKSEFGLVFMKKIVLREDLIQPDDFFFSVRNLYRGYEFVNDDVVRLVEKSKLKGIEFIAIEDIRTWK